MSGLDRLANLFARILQELSAVLLALILLTVFMQVVFRDVLQLTVPWTEEAARYLNVWMVFLGCSVAAARRAHIRVTFISDSLKGLAHDLLTLATLALMFAFDVIVFLGAIQLTQMNWDQQATTFPLTVSVLYIALIISSFFAGLFILYHVGRLLSRIFRGRGGA